MKLVLQRVAKAAVYVEGRQVASIGKGLVVLAGIEKGDEAGKIEAAARKVVQLRIFEDAEGKTNLSVQDIKGSILVVSQFTLAADLKKGNRPSFDSAEKPEAAEGLIRNFVDALKQFGLEVKEGRFGEHMQVELVNDGPATYLIG